MKKHSKHKIEVGVGHYYEMMDRLSVIADHIHYSVAEHPVSQKHNKIEEGIEKLLLDVYKLYQIAGGLHMDAYELEVNKLKKQCVREYKERQKKK